MPHGVGVIREDLNHPPLDGWQEGFQRQAYGTQLQQVDVKAGLYQRPESSDFHLSQMTSPTQQ